MRLYTFPALYFLRRYNDGFGQITVMVVQLIFFCLSFPKEWWKLMLLDLLNMYDDDPTT